MFCDRGYTDLGTRGYLGGRVIIQYTKHPEKTLFNNPVSKIILNNHASKINHNHASKINHNHASKINHNHASKINHNTFSKMFLNNHFKSFPIENILKINNNPVLKSCHTNLITKT